MSTSIKRQLSPSPSTTPKAPRVIKSLPAWSPLLCTLPPTCHPPNHPTPLSDTRALEAHYATHHAHVCSSPGCGCVFPDARLLELHLTECHDPLAAVRKERGENIFACHLVSCHRMFATPKTRRLHLISAHAYPKEYFFAVTNKGIGGLLSRWGDGASLLRGPWRPRDTENDNQGDAGSSSVSASQHLDLEDHSTDNSSKEVSFSPNSASASAAAAPEVGMDKMNEDGHGDEIGDAEVEMLTRDVSAISLVPSSVRFGRGGTASRGRAGLATRNGRPAARHMGNPPHSKNRTTTGNADDDRGQDHLMRESDAIEPGVAAMPDKPLSGRGRHGRGRAGGDGRGGGGGGRGMGRARGFVPPPPRSGFLLRGGAGRGLSRGSIAMRARGRGAAVI